DPNRAAEVLVASARKANVALSVDTTAHERLRKRLPFAWAVVTDALAPADVAAWLAAARNEAEAGPANGRLSGSLHVVPAGRVEEKEWRELLGGEPAWAKPNRAEAAPKSVSAATRDQGASAPQKSGAPGR